MSALAPCSKLTRLLPKSNVVISCSQDTRRLTPRRCKSLVTDSLRAPLLITVKTELQTGTATARRNSLGGCDVFSFPSFNSARCPVGSGPLTSVSESFNLEWRKIPGLRPSMAPQLCTSYFAQSDYPRLSAAKSQFAPKVKAASVSRQASYQATRPTRTLTPRAVGTVS